MFSNALTPAAQRDDAAFRRDAVRALKCAFLAARTLTRSDELAESAVFGAIEKWDPEVETADRLLLLAVTGAAKAERGAGGDSESTPAGSLRTCSVSRLLSGGIERKERRAERHWRLRVEQLAGQRG